MGNLFESLKDYFENTPKGVLDNDWKEVENLNEIGPDVIEYARYVKELFGVDDRKLQLQCNQSLATS